MRSATPERPPVESPLSSGHHWSSWEKVTDASIGCYDASVGFSDATEGGIATPPSEVNAETESLEILASSLVVFGGKDRFRIGAGNFAHRDPAEATNQRAD